MEWPSEVPVMTLPNATLFPQALLPLYIFEPRYRQMLADALASHRMFSVAMQKPGRQREIPSKVAGLGLIRVAVGHKDGTSHLILQGVARVALAEAVRTRPYRLHRVLPLPAVTTDNVVVDALLAKVRELVRERLELGLPFPYPVIQEKIKEKFGVQDAAELFSADQVRLFLEQLDQAEQVADLVSCSLLPRATDRQIILETVGLEDRLKHLIHFLLAEITRIRNDQTA
jgi:ATP-dependent Lon protease